MLYEVVIACIVKGIVCAVPHHEYAGYHIPQQPRGMVLVVVLVRNGGWDKDRDRTRREI